MPIAHRAGKPQEPWENYIRDRCYRIQPHKQFLRLSIGFHIINIFLRSLLPITKFYQEENKKGNKVTLPRKRSKLKFFTYCFYSRCKFTIVVLCWGFPSYICETAEGNFADTFSLSPFLDPTAGQTPKETIRHAISFLFRGIEFGAARNCSKT